MSFVNQQAALGRELRTNIQARALGGGLGANIYTRATELVCLSTTALMSCNACHTLERDILNAVIRADALVFFRHVSFLSCRTSGFF